MRASPTSPPKLAAAVLTLAVGIVAATPALAQAPPNLPAAEVERIVREYLLREPEVVYQAIQELQRRQEVAQAEIRKQALALHRDRLVADPGDPVGGDPAGDVTVVEFFDYRCGYCKSMAPAIREFIASDPKIRFVFKDMPILSPESAIAAKAGLAAVRQGKYPEFHFALMQSRELTADAVLALAGKVGLDPARLAADMEDPAIAARIEDNLALAQALGIDGTPAFVVGDTVVPGATEIAKLAELVGAERAAARN